MKKEELSSIPDQQAVAEVTAAVEKGSGQKPSPTSKAPNFSQKEKKFLKGIVTEVIPGKVNPKTGKKTTKRDVAMEVYDAKDPQVASVIASENLAKPKFKDALAAAFEAADITVDSLAETLRDAMLATKTASLQGQVFPSDEPDHGVRVSAAKAAASLMAAAEGNDKSPANIFNFNSGTQNFVKVPEQKQ